MEVSGSLYECELLIENFLYKCICEEVDKVAKSEAVSEAVSQMEGSVLESRGDYPTECHGILLNKLGFKIE